jgi:hypothetical protein
MYDNASLCFREYRQFTGRVHRKEVMPRVVSLAFIRQLAYHHSNVKTYSERHDCPDRFPVYHFLYVCICSGSRFHATTPRQCVDITIAGADPVIPVC